MPENNQETHLYKGKLLYSVFQLFETSPFPTFTINDDEKLLKSMKSQMRIYQKFNDKTAFIHLSLTLLKINF